MLTKLDVRLIVVDQLTTLRRFGSNALDVREILLFFGAPLAWSIVQLALHYRVSDELINLLVTSASIFAGLLLNLLVLLYTVATRPERPNVDAARADQARRLLKETFYNISFCILVSVLLVVFCLLFPTGEKTSIPLKRLEEGLIYYFAFQLILALMVVLKRIHALLRFELS